MSRTWLGFEIGILAGVALAAAGMWVYSLKDRPVFVAIDGDTVRISRTSLRGVGLRAAGFDAPEIRRAKCPEERAAGVRLRDELQAAITAGTFTVSLTGKKAGFNRPEAVFLINGEDVSVQWLAEGRVVKWVKGVDMDWCERLIAGSG